jgi:hypothetical protein
MSKTPQPRPYQPSRAELAEIAHDFARAAQEHARLDRMVTCEFYLSRHEQAREAIDRRDAAELDLDIPISVDELDLALFAQESFPSTVRSL